MMLDAISGLRNLGYRETEARAAVEAALAVLAGEPGTLETLVVAALKLNGAAMLAREPSATYGAAAMRDELSMTSKSEAVYGSAHVGAAIADELPAWVSEFLRRAMAEDRCMSVSLRPTVTTPAA